MRNSRATGKLSLCQAGGEAMLLHGRPEAIAILGLPQVIEGGTALQGSLRAHRHVHVLEQNERAERVLRRREG